MSPSNINSFVGDLVQMATAFENLPKIEAERDELKQKLDDALGTVQARELAIVVYKQEIDTLHSRIRSLEVERDDASFRVLEVEERTEKLERSFQSALEAMDATDRLIQSFKPIPMPEPVKEPEPQAQPVTTPAEGSQSASVPEAVHSISDTGQSESSPTVKEQTISSETVSLHSAPSMVADTTAGSVDPGPALGPYFGKRYRDVAGYVSYQNWIDGGGTYDDYYGNRS